MMPSVTPADSLAAATAETQVAHPAAPPSTSRSLPRFLIIGVLSFVVDAGTLFVAHGLLKVWLPLATTLAYGLAFVVNFGLNRRWAFASTGALTGQAARYLALVGVNFVITLVMVNGIAALGVSYLIAKVLATAVIAGVNYLAYRNWIFR
jgi:putative flippase GtrA